MLHGRLTGGRLADYFDLRVGQHALQPAADHGVVIGNQQANLVLLGRGNSWPERDAESGWSYGKATIGL
jgi:hypothetical protein